MFHLRIQRVRQGLQSDFRQFRELDCSSFKVGSSSKSAWPMSTYASAGTCGLSSRGLPGFRRVAIILLLILTKRFGRLAHQADQQVPAENSQTER